MEDNHYQRSQTDTPLTGEGRSGQLSFLPARKVVPEDRLFERAGQTRDSHFRCDSRDPDSTMPPELADLSSHGQHVAQDDTSDVQGDRSWLTEPTLQDKASRDDSVSDRELVVFAVLSTKDAEQNLLTNTNMNTSMNETAVDGADQGMAGESLPGVKGYGREEEEDDRQTWDKKLDFLLAIIGFAIDLGNVWRFPYVCYKNGGGAFLFPYLVMLVFLGMPLFFMELALGQFHRQGPISIWRSICPMMCGVGYGICVVATSVGFYYNTLIAYALYYLVMSFRSPLVYASCDNKWNTPHCVTPAQIANRTNESVSSVTEFYVRHLQERHLSTGMDDLGGIRWQLMLCLATVFITIVLCIWKGTKSTGKAVWVTATLPFFMLGVLLVRGMTLPGAETGLLFYLSPDFSRLADLGVWVDAAAQIFFSLGPGFGTLIALSSYNKFHNNCFRDAVLTSSINCFTSFLAGLVVFSVLGYMAHVQNTTVEKVAAEGPGLVFLVYAEALSMLDGSVFWAIVFFILLIALGLDSSFGGLEAVITGLADEFAVFRKRRTLLVIGVCLYCFLLALPTVTYAGAYYVMLLDSHAAPVSLIFICFVEVIAVNWIYGVQRFAQDIKSMLGFGPSAFWLVCWVAICPIGLLLLFCLSYIRYEGLQLDGYVFPEWAELLGWLLTHASIVCIPAYMAWSFCRAKGSFRERWRQMTTPVPLEMGMRSAHQNEHEAVG